MCTAKSGYLLTSDTRVPQPSAAVPLIRSQVWAIIFGKDTSACVNASFASQKRRWYTPKSKIQKTWTKAQMIGENLDRQNLCAEADGPIDVA